MLGGDLDGARHARFGRRTDEEQRTAWAEGLEPAVVWNEFAALSAIPRRSKDEEAARRHIVARLDDLGIAARVDDGRQRHRRHPRLTRRRGSGHRGAPGPSRHGLRGRRGRRVGSGRRRRVPERRRTAGSGPRERRSAPTTASVSPSHSPSRPTRSRRPVGRPGRRAHRSNCSSRWTRRRTSAAPPVSTPST